MTENQPISSGAAQGGAIRIGAPASTKTSTGANAASATSGATFQALIEELEVKARLLASESEKVAGPTDLAQAVDHAHSSLQDALLLGDRLLEAYRAALHVSDAPANTTLNGASKAAPNATKGRS
jgi:hypothetical protein